MAPDTAGRARAARWPFLLVVLAYAAVATWRLALPGIYMDEVNPDYLVVKVLNPQHARIVEWVLPGNLMLGGRVPLLVALYHGSQTAWFGLPFYALLGTTVEGLRLTHAMFAIAILAAWLFCLRRLAVPAAVTTIAGILLAVDPSFTFAFRTQSYITVFGVVWILLALGIVCNADANARPRWWAAGAFMGLAASQYFIHAFFLPVLAPAVWWRTRTAHAPWRARAAWLGGLVLGLAPYLIGYARIAWKLGGPSSFLAFAREQTTTLGAFASPLSPAERVWHLARMLEQVVSNAWHHGMMFNELTPVAGYRLKLALLVILPAVLWMVAEARRSATFGLRVLIAMPIVFLGVALVFGSRIAGHHVVVLLPLLYAALAVGWHDAWRTARVRESVADGARERASRSTAAPIVERVPSRTLHAVRGLAGAAIALALLASHAGGQVWAARRLDATGGVGLMSDAINRFAADLNAATRKPYVYTPDWGIALPIVFLTNGSVDVDHEPDFARARALRCKGRDVAVALLKDPASRRAEWDREMGGAPASVQAYRQRDGVPVFEVVLYRGDARNPACARSNRMPEDATRPA